MEDPFQVVKDEVQKTINMAIGLYYHWCELSNNNLPATKEELDWTTNELKNCLRSIEWDLEDLDETILIVERYIKKFKIPPSEIETRKQFIQQTRQSVKEMRDHLTNPTLKTLETTALLQESQVIDCLSNLQNNMAPNNIVNNNTYHLNSNNENNIFTINNSTITNLSMKPNNNHYTKLNDEDDDDDDGVGGSELPRSPVAQCLCLNMDEGIEEPGNQHSSPQHEEHAIMLGQHRGMYPQTSKTEKLLSFLGLRASNTLKRWVLLVTFVIIIIIIIIVLLVV